MYFLFFNLKCLEYVAQVSSEEELPTLHIEEELYALAIPFLRLNAHFKQSS